MDKPTVVFDFDGVIHSYISGWEGVDVANDPPVSGIKEAIEEIRKEYNVVVVSTRCKTDMGIDCIDRYLKRYDIVVDGIVYSKPPAVCYIDDRAICFDGDSNNLVSKIKNFRTWNSDEQLSIKKLKHIAESMIDYCNENSTCEKCKFKSMCDGLDIHTNTIFRLGERMLYGIKDAG